MKIGFKFEIKGSKYFPNIFSKNGSRGVFFFKFRHCAVRMEGYVFFFSFSFVCFLLFLFLYLFFFVGFLFSWSYVSGGFENGPKSIRSKRENWD